MIKVSLKKIRNRKRQLRNYQDAIKRAKQQRNCAIEESQKARGEADKVLWYYRQYRKAANAVTKRASDDVKSLRVLLEFIYNFTEEDKIRDIIDEYKERAKQQKQVYSFGRKLYLRVWEPVYSIVPSAIKPSAVARLEREWDAEDASKEST